VKIGIVEPTRSGPRCPKGIGDPGCQRDEKGIVVAGGFDDARGGSSTNGDYTKDICWVVISHGGITFEMG